MDKIYLEIDVGSVSTNIVIVDPAGQVLLLTRYYRNDANRCGLLKTA